MLIYTLAAIGLLSFLLFADKTRWRELFPCALFIVFIRFTEQYIMADILHIWTYHKLTNAFSLLMNIPVVVDLGFYSVFGYLFIQNLPVKRLGRFFWLNGWAFLFTVNEYIAVYNGTIEQVKFWHPFLSYMLYVLTLTLLILQYQFYKVKGAQAA